MMNDPYYDDGVNARPMTQAETFAMRLQHLPTEVLGAMLVALRDLDEFKAIWDAIDKVAIERGI